jgi:hypothetical protein
MLYANYIFQYRFYPVGQGLFSSGSISRSSHKNNLNNSFIWVYDCGTAISNQKLLEQNIADFSQKTNNNDTISLVVLSHFDNDHISGVVKLLSNFKVDILLLPYIPLWQRLLIAFDEGMGENNSMMLFYINPAEYLLRQDNKGINRFIFVNPSGETGPALITDKPIDPPPDDTPLKVEIDFDEPDDEEGRKWIDEKKYSTEIKFLKAGGSLRLPYLWEFVPYNDQKLFPSCDDDFFYAVESQKQELLNGNNAEIRNAALKSLKKIYDGKFGKSSKKRNEISLMLYGGLIKSTFLKARTCVCPIAYSLFQDRPCHYLCNNLECREFSCQCSILYTGDAYLDTAERTKRLKKFLKEERINNIGIFQVMHHGSKHNWRSGLAKKINPIMSIFCSDPSSAYGHPHASVLRDFWNYAPIQVDTQKGAVISGDIFRNNKKH